MIEQQQPPQQGYYNFNEQQQFTALQLRLDTRPLLQDIENYLRGYRYSQVWDEKQQFFIVKQVKIGQPKANEEGIQSVLGLFASVINSSFVQGNWKEARFDNNLYRTRKYLIWNIMLNIYKWQIDNKEVSNIMDMLMSFYEGYASRLIDNKEREGYIPTMRTVETLQSQTVPEEKRGGLFSFLSRGNK